MEKNKLHILYDIVIDNEELNEEILLKNGLSLEDIDQFVYDGVLTENCDLSYKFTNYIELCDYAQVLLVNKEFEKARKALNLVSDMNPRYLKANYRLFYESVFSRDEEYILKSFLRMHSTHDQSFIIDNNVCLYLLSFTMKLPPVFKEYLKTLGYKDMTFSNKEYEYSWINSVYENIYKNKFKFALKNINDYINQNGYTNMRCSLVKLLLKRTIDTQKEYIPSITSLVENHQYEEALEILKNKPNVTALEKTFILILENIILAKETNLHIKNTSFQTSNVFNAIMRGNYNLALEISMNKDKNTNNKSLLTLLLEKLCTLNNINLAMPVDEEYENIVYKIKNKTYDLTESLKEYLEKINKADYFYLIQNLINLNELNGEQNNLKIFVILSQLSKDEYKFNINEYVELFNASLENKELQKAKVYLNIILNSDAITNEKVDLHGLKERVQKFSDSINDEYDLSIDDLIKIKHDELLATKGIVLFKPLDPITTEVVLKKAHEMYDDLSIISIGLKETRQLFFIYKPNCREIDNLQEFIRTADELYYSNRFEEALEHYIKLLHFGKPKYSVYSKIGFCYLKLNQKEQGLDYLKVASNMLKKENPENNYYDSIIESLSKEVKRTTNIDEILKLELKLD